MNYEMSVKWKHNDLKNKSRFLIIQRYSIEIRSGFNISGVGSYLQINLVEWLCFLGLGERLGS